MSKAKKPVSKTPKGKAISIWSSPEDRALYTQIAQDVRKPLSEIVRVLVRCYADGTFEPRDLPLISATKSKVKAAKPKTKPKAKPKAKAKAKPKAKPKAKAAEAAEITTVGVIGLPTGTGTAP